MLMYKNDIHSNIVNTVDLIFMRDMLRTKTKHIVQKENVDMVYVIEDSICPYYIHIITGSISY